jgi:cytochrome c oxidase cbb3-type subunit III
MTDFYSGFWDYYVAIISIVSVVGCGVFLWLQTKRTVKVQLNAQGEPQTTGHVWDGDLQEFHNPMPRWWIWLFYLTIAFSVLYLVLYPGLGTQWRGTLNWTQTGQYEGEIKAADAKFAPIFDAFAKLPLEQVAADAKARTIGERLFMNNCAQCHGTDARGSRGFPNLTDAEWMVGRTPDAIKATIRDGRTGVMPPMGAALGGQEAVIDVAHYVLSLSNSSHDAVRAVRGKDSFAACGACHGADGSGNAALGAPDLTNRIWLYGGTVAAIADTITKGRTNVMPKHSNVLTEAEIHLVAAYVWSLSPVAPGK